jgi:TnpA family transposase
MQYDLESEVDKDSPQYRELCRQVLKMSIDHLERGKDELESAYPNLQPVLTRPINWELIRRQYDQMIKYATAIRLGTAETEPILRRFTRENLKHPTYQALLELGRALRTVFLCEYLHRETLRREINEGLNVIELWNDVNDFILFGKGGEIVTNRRESQELAILCLHLLQNCLVYINTLMVQQVLMDPVLISQHDSRGFPGTHAFVFYSY